MAGNNHVRRLPLGDKRGNDSVQPGNFLFCKIYPFSGRYKEFFVVTVGGFGIVIIFGLYGTHVPWFTAAIADIGSILNLAAVFPFKAAADIVAAMAGAAQGVTDDQLTAGVGFPASVPVDTEVVGIVKTAVVPRVHNAVFSNLFEDG